MLRVFLDVKDSSKARATFTQNCATESLLDNPNKSSTRTYGKIVLAVPSSVLRQQYHPSASSLYMEVRTPNKFAESTKANLAIKLPEEKNQN